MMDLSIQQVLTVYSDLVRAYYNENHYGSDTAEVYAYLLKHNNPSAEIGDSDGKINHSAIKEDNLQAAENLYNVILLFKDHFNCIIYVENKLFGKWVKNIDFGHRVHIKIKRK